MNIRRMITIGTLGLILACNQPQTDHGQAGHDHEHSGQESMVRQITEWTPEYEFFIEIVAHSEERSTDFLLHVTVMQDFKPLAAESLSLVMGDGPNSEILDMHPERSGIFSAQTDRLLSSDTPLAVRIGDQEFELFHGHEHGDSDHDADVTDQDHDHDHDHIASDHSGTVHTDPSADHHEHDSDADHAHAHNETEHAETRTSEPEHAHSAMVGTEFAITKEQQWLLDMQVAKADSQALSQSVTAIGRILPSQEQYARIVSPVDGFLNIEHNRSRVAPGQRVEKGEVLLTICPPVGTSNTLAERVLSYRQARNNYERAKELLKRNAISEKEFEEIEQNYRVAKASYETLMQAYGIQDLDSSQSCMHFNLRAPISGIVQDLHFVSGQAVASGEELLSVVDPSVVWLEAEVFEDDFYKVDEISRLSLRIPGRQDPLVYTAGQFTPLNTGQTMRADSRTVPLLIRLPNENQTLKIGQVLQTQLSGSEHQQHLVLPRAALVDEDTNFFVFVQHGGETFEKRPVQIGVRQQDQVSVTQGLSAGERVVTKGAFRVNLATSQTSVGHGHIH